MPAQALLCFVRTRDKRGRVTGAARADARRDALAAYTLGDRDQLEYGMTLSGAQVGGEAFATTP